MRPWTLSSLLAVSLTFGASGETRSELLSQISLKEKQLAEIQKELIVLRNKLAIPDAPGSSYTVKTGDTIHSIAKEFKVAAEALKDNAPLRAAAAGHAATVAPPALVREMLKPAAAVGS